MLSGRVLTLLGPETEDRLFIELFYDVSIGKIPPYEERLKSVSSIINRKIDDKKELAALSLHFSVEVFQVPSILPIFLFPPMNCCYYTADITATSARYSLNHALRNPGFLALIVDS